VIAANALLQQHQLEDALLALLDVWRTSREPRVANLIDLVSARVASTQPLPGKSVSARDDAWRALAKQKQSADLPRLFAALWPKQWRDARPLLDLLDRFPDDPRLAAMLVRTASDPPYTSSASQAFFKLVFEKIGKLGDRRGLEVLATLRDPLALGAIAAIARRAVGAVDEGALAAAEAYFAGDVARGRADAERGDALLAAIHAAPDDDAPRAVYADWLVERGDRRGELIALQLADGDTRERERELLRDHGRSWAGDLGKAFDADGLVFERGFLAGGSLRAKDATYLEDPAARLVTTIHCSESPDITIPLLRHLPSLRKLSTSAATAAALATHDQPSSITELATWLPYDLNDASVGAALARCAALPALRKLRIYSDSADAVRWLLDAPILDRLEQLELSGNAVMRDIVAALLGRPSALRTVAFDRRSWSATLTRATPNDPFDACRLETGVRQAAYLTHDLDAMLDALPSTLARIDFDLGEHRLDAERRALIAPALARFANATIVLPTEETVKVEEADALVLSIELSGRGLLDREHLQAIWALLAEAGQTYDALVVGSGKALKPLGDDPLARLGTWAANAKTDEVTLRRTTRRDRALISAHRPDNRYSSPTSRRTKIDLVVRNGDSGIPAWFVRLLKLAQANWAACEVPNVDRAFVHFDRKPIPLCWLSLVTPDIAARYPIDKVAGDGVSLVRDGDVTMLVTAPTPAEVTPARLALVAERLRALGGI